MRMIYTKRMFFSCNIVSQNEVKLKLFTSSARYRCYGIMRDAFRLRKNKCIFVCISAPFFKYFFGKIGYCRHVVRTQSYNRKRPFNNSGLNIFKSVKRESSRYRRPFHCELISSALHMIVRKDRAAHYRQIRI